MFQSLRLNVRRYRAIPLLFVVMLTFLAVTVSAQDDMSGSLSVAGFNGETGDEIATVRGYSEKHTPMWTSPLPKGRWTNSSS
jgi:hypothetical protein